MSTKILPKKVPSPLLTSRRPQHMPAPREQLSEYTLAPSQDDTCAAAVETKIAIAAPGMGGAGSTGGRVWSCAPLMLDELSSKPHLVRGLTCIELGAGLGLVGIAAACLGAHVVGL